LNIGSDVETFEKAGVDLLHVDIMDGHFVPNMALNPDIVRDLKNKHGIPVDVHLMVTNPGAYIKRFSGYNADMISFHIEAVTTPIRLLNEIKSHGIKAGITLNPATPVSILEHTFAHVDFIELMSVEPGYSGQEFMDSTYEKITRLDNIRKENGFKYEIEIDGGIDFENSVECVKKGANILVLGALCIYRPGVDLYDETVRIIKKLKDVKI
jgi:ribulose-phosphate 3-epimerase